MHRKTRVVITGVLGGLLLTMPVFAQSMKHTLVTPGSTAQPGCPVGCAPVVSRTPAQREAARRASERRRLAAESAPTAEQLAAYRARAERAEADAQLLRAQAEQDRAAIERAASLECDREREREAALESENANMAAVARAEGPARGGGPNHDRRGVHLLIGVEGGFGGFTGDAANGLHVGPTWGARAGIEVMNWLGVEARYFGMWNATNPETTLGNVGLVTSELTGMLRLAIPTPYVRPYGLVGIGGAWNNVTASNPSVRQATHLRTDESGVVPVGGGIDVPIGPHWGVGFEGMYHYYMHQDFSTDPIVATGGQWHTSMNVHWSL